MAKVTGPLHSEDARGTLAGMLTFRSGNGPRTCRKTGRSTKPLTEAQQLHHTAFSMLAAAWSAADPADRLTWSPLAVPANVTAYAAYIQFNFARIAAGLSTVTAYPPVDTPVMVLHVAPGSPAANPDCSGDYCVIGQSGGQPIYSRYPDYDYIILTFEDDLFWYIFPVPEHPDGWCWLRTTSPIGTFAHSGFAGHPVASLII